MTCILTRTPQNAPSGLASVPDGQMHPPMALDGGDTEVEVRALDLRDLGSCDLAEPCMGQQGGANAEYMM